MAPVPSFIFRRHLLVAILHVEDVFMNCTPTSHHSHLGAGVMHLSWHACQFYILADRLQEVAQAWSEANERAHALCTEAIFQEL